MLTRAKQQFRLEIEELFAPLAKRACIGLAVSGGADSLALMLLAHQWADKQNNPPKIIVYSLDHGFRADAAQETALVQRHAGELGLACRVLDWDGHKPDTGVQAAARKARYSLIGAAMAQDGADVLLTAHHVDDQAETLLMRMAHGSGLAGLGGMRCEAMVEDVQVFRPLLDVPQDALEAVLIAKGWQWVSDPSNDDPHYERVRWRQMMPQLAQLGLGAPVFARLAKRLRRAETALDGIADDVFGQIGVIDGFGVVRLSAIELRAQHLEIQVRLVQKALRKAGSQRKPFALAQIEQTTLALRALEFAPQTLLGCKISRHQDSVVVAREGGRMADETIEISAGAQLEWDGRFVIDNLSEAHVLVQPAKHFTKALLAEKMGHSDFLMADIAGAPVVTTKNGAVLSLGTHIFDEMVCARLC